MSQDKIESETSRAYFSQVPHILFDYDISHTEFRLWCYYNRVGNCWQSVETTAKGAGMSMGAVSNARKGLEEKGLIYVSGNEYGTSNIRVKDLWPENMAKYANPSRNEGQSATPSKFEGHPSNPEGYPSNFETKNNPTITIQKEERESAPPAPPSPKPAPHQSAYVAQFETHEPIIADMIKALREVTLHNNTAVLAERARELVAIQATPEEIRELFSGQGSYWYTAGAGAWGRGGRPNVGNIISDIYKAREWQQNGGGDSKKAAREADLLHAEWIAPLAGMNGQAGEWFRQSPSRLKAVLRTNGVGTVEQAARVKVDDLRVWFSDSIKGQVTQ